MELQEIEKMIVDRAAKVGAQEALAFLNGAADEKKRKVLRNTKVLLMNYRAFKLHTQESVDKAKVTVTENRVEISETVENDFMNDEIDIESIMRSKARTVAILKHIDRMLDTYRYMTEKGKTTDQRKYWLIFWLYIDDVGADGKGKVFTIEDMAAHFCVDRTVIHKSLTKAYEELGILLFGVDALPFMRAC